MLRKARFCPLCAGRLRRTRPAGDHLPRLACGECGFILYLGLKVAAGTVAVRRGRVVLVRRGVDPGKGLWSFPCGYAEISETLERCARRETLEETGLRVRLHGLLGAYSYPRRHDPVSRVAVVAYAAEVTGGRMRAGDDVVDVALFRPGAIPWKDLAFPSSHEALRGFLARYAHLL